MSAASSARWRRLRIAAAVCLLAILAVRIILANRADPSLQRVRQAGVLIVALDASYPPFETTDGQGNFGGFDVAVAHEIARRLGVQAQFANISFDSLYDALASRRADVVISGLRYEAERTRDVIYTPSYFDAGQVFMVRGDGRIAKPADLAGQTVAVEWASEGEIEARKLAKTVSGMQVQTFETQKDGLAALRSGAAAAAVADHVSALELTLGQPDLRLLWPPFAPDPLVMAGHTADRTLMAEMSRIVRAMQEEGLADRLMREQLAQ